MGFEKLDGNSKLHGQEVDHRQGLQLQIFQYGDEDHFEDIGTIEIDGEIWFIGSSVCKILGIRNAPDAISRLDDDEKLLSVVPIAGQDRKTYIINESGLYSLIFKSRKPNAKKFKKWVTKEVIPSIRRTGGYGKANSTPAFVRRFNLNWDRTDIGYFSVISELFIRLYGKLEQVGYTIPEKSIGGTEMRPDVSVGRHFVKHLKTHYPEVEELHRKYPHIFEGGNTVKARQYPNEYLHIFIDFVDTVWIPKYATKYFEERDFKALDYLPKLLPSKTA